jgi:hypothetical protein
MSFVSSTGLQQYPARGLVFLAVGTDFGKASTFSRSVFKILKATLLGKGSGTFFLDVGATIFSLTFRGALLSLQAGRASDLEGQVPVLDDPG